MKKLSSAELQFNTPHRNLIVAETFYSLQGEGPTAGTPAVFLRLGGCNLLCKGSGWVCDSIDVWKHGSAVHFQHVFSHEHIKRLKDGAHLIITGGEPLLHQEAIVHFLYYLQISMGLTPYTEIETNGTIVPVEALRKMIDRWNVSFKLSSTGEPFTRRVNETALGVFSRMRTTFKIVISGESDIQELLQDFHDLVDFKKIMLMPAGDTQELLNARRRMVMEHARDLGFMYSDRLHILGWNQKTGV